MIFLQISIHVIFVKIGVKQIFKHTSQFYKRFKNLSCWWDYV